MKLTLIPLILLLTPALVLASAGEGHHGAPELDEHTIKTIIYQAINVAILAGGLFYFLKDTVRSYFKEKQAQFVAAAGRAETARRQAEQERLQIQVQLTKLESTADETLSRARAEAVDMRNQMVAEAQAVSKRLKDEAEAAARLEVEKAKTALRDQMIREAAALAEKSIQDKVSREDHQRLQGDFIQNIGTVQS